VDDEHTPPTEPGPGDETLVPDHRAALSPSEHVERRLIDLLKSSPLMVSQIHRRLKPGRGPS
jgi:hypothetical protein